MPATVSIFNGGGGVLANGEVEDGDSSSSSSGAIATESNLESDSGSNSESESNRVVVEEARQEGALVVLTLGPPEVDSGTGNTVFSLSAEEKASVSRGWGVRGGGVCEGGWGSRGSLEQRT